MIRYRWTGTTPLMDAAQYKLPGSQQLQGCGPWEWNHRDGHTVATMVDDRPECWGDWRQGIGPYEVSLADPLPEFRGERWLRTGAEGVECLLTCGRSILVRPLSFEGRGIDWDGNLGRAITTYGRKVESLLDRIAGGDDPPANDPQLLDVVRDAIRHCYAIPIELMHAFGLIADDGVGLIVGAIADPPKA